MQSTERICPLCNDSDTEEQDISYFKKQDYLLVCENCWYCPKRTKRAPQSDPWQQFWDQRQESDGRVRPVGGYKRAYP